jgi:hypothetical protein
MNRKEAQFNRLKMALDSYSPQVDQSLIIKAVAQTNHKIKKIKQFSDKYMGIAVTGVISDMTPPNIRLLGMSVDLGNMSSENNTENKKKMLILEGIVFGDRSTFEATLAGYLVKLKSSPIISQFNINTRSFEFVEEKEVLRFTAQLELV